MTAQTILPANTLSGGYNVANSLRFNDGDSAYLNFTPSSNGSRRIFTISFWFKTTTVAGGSNYIFSTGNYAGGDGFLQILLSSSGRLTVDDYDQSGDSYNLRWGTPSTYLIRDPSAWYHFVLAVDSTQGTQSNRAKIYINGVNVSSDFTQTNSPTQNDDFHVNTSSQLQQIGRSQNNNNYYDGYLAEFVMIDGSALAPTSFGEFDEDSGIWKPIDVSGLTFGTNGFYLDFENSGSLGADVSGNGNNFTVNNLTAIDQTTDTPTNNFCTLNPLDNLYNGGTFSEGNLKVVTADSIYGAVTSTIGINSGKWYAEFKVTDAGRDFAMVGIKSTPATSNGDGVGANDGYAYYSYNGKKVHGGTETTYGATYDDGDIIGVAVDLDNNKIYFSKNGTFQNSGDPTSGATGTGSAFDLDAPPSGFYFFSVSNEDNADGGTWEANFGNPPYTISSGNTDGNGYGNFEYEVPNSYLSLCTANISEVLG